MKFTGSFNERILEVTDDELKSEARKQRRLEALGTNEPACGLCGETDWRCMELDHVAPQRFDDTTVILCRNCHRKKSDDQKSLPPFDPEADPVLATIGQFLLGLALLFRRIIETLEKFGRELIKHSTGKPIGGAA
jgi:hypothetical protein